MSNKKGLIRCVFQILREEDCCLGLSPTVVRKLKAEWSLQEPTLH